MNISRQMLVTLVVGSLVLAAVSGTVGYRFAHRPEQGSERKALYWYDPMQPDQHFDKPGKSPFMDMQLIPKYADETRAGEGGGVKIDARAVQNLGIRLTTVARGPLTRPYNAVGSIGFNLRDVAVLQARSSGFVTRVYARAPGDLIKRDAPIVDLMIPQWSGAQLEFIALLQSGDAHLIQAARERLRLLGMSENLVSTVEATRKAQSTITIRSPFSGVIVQLDAREGMSISSGATIASINALATVWLEAAIPEARGVNVSIGRPVKIRLTAFPGEVFPGQVIALLPQANTETRTLRARIEVPNPAGRLRPGLFANVSLDSGDSEPVVYVDSEAVIRTGTRTVAIVAGEAGHFVPTTVETGDDIDGKTVILSGLSEGQRVVASGQFLIDSEANLNGVLARLSGAGSTGQQP